jgi:hypothetical protein
MFITTPADFTLDFFFCELYLEKIADQKAQLNLHAQSRELRLTRRLEDVERKVHLVREISSIQIRTITNDRVVTHFSSDHPLTLRGT